MFFPLLYYVPTAQLSYMHVICKISICKEKLEAAQGYGPLSTILEKSLLFKKLEKKCGHQQEKQFFIHCHFRYTHWNPLACEKYSVQSRPLSLIFLQHIYAHEQARLHSFTALEQEGPLRFTRFAWYAVASLLFSSWFQHAKTLRDTRS